MPVSSDPRDYINLADDEECLEDEEEDHGFILFRYLAAALAIFIVGAFFYFLDYNKRRHKAKPEDEKALEDAEEERPRVIRNVTKTSEEVVHFSHGATAKHESNGLEPKSTKIEAFTSAAAAINIKPPAIVPRKRQSIETPIPDSPSDQRPLVVQSVTPTDNTENQQPFIQQQQQQHHEQEQEQHQQYSAPVSPVSDAGVSMAPPQEGGPRQIVIQHKITLHHQTNANLIPKTESSSPAKKPVDSEEEEEESDDEQVPDFFKRKIKIATTSGTKVKSKQPMPPQIESTFSPINDREATPAEISEIPDIDQPLSEPFLTQRPVNTPDDFIEEIPEIDDIPTDEQSIKSVPRQLVIATEQQQQQQQQQLAAAISEPPISPTNPDRPRLGTPPVFEGGKKIHRKKHRTSRHSGAEGGESAGSSVSVSLSSSASNIPGSKHNHKASHDEVSDSVPNISSDGSKRRKDRPLKKRTSFLEAAGVSDTIEAMNKVKNLHELSRIMQEAGLERSNLIFGIDYTASNKYQGEESFDCLSLHTIRNDLLNPYQQVILILGNTLLPFATSGYFPVYGFGDIKTSDFAVFPLKETGYCTSFNEVLDVYNEVTPLVQLSGPTNFAPLIYQAMEICKEINDYHILVIVADGQVTNERATKRAIVEACRYPLSIIVVGVGDGPWDMMRVFDESLPKRPWDNFHFVEFHEVMRSNKENPDVAFAVQTLLEVPDQYKQIKDLGLLNG